MMICSPNIMSDPWTHVAQTDSLAIVFKFWVSMYWTSLFHRYIKLGVTPDSIEGMYQKAHAAIRADPTPKAKVEKKVTKKRWTAAKIGLEARKAKVAAAKEAFLAQIEDQKE